MKVRPFNSNRRSFILQSFVFIVALLPPTSSFSQSAQNPAQPLVFTHVTVIDATGAPAQREMTVVVSGERISEIGRTGKVKVSKDSQVVDAFPGFSLHDELELLVEAGLKPMEALQAATRNPAEYLGQLSSLGTVEKGKLADLVLLDANPLERIANTKRIAAVVVNGKLLTKAQLTEMLAGVERAAAAGR